MKDHARGAHSLAQSVQITLAAVCDLVRDDDEDDDEDEDDNAARSTKMANPRKATTNRAVPTRSPSMSLFARSTPLATNDPVQGVGTGLRAQETQVPPPPTINVSA